MKEDRLVPISVDALVPGMELDYDVYYKSKDKFILLVHDKLLTPGAIMRMRQSSMWVYNIYVPAELRHKILADSQFFKETQRNLEKRVGYTDAKKQISSLFSGTDKDTLVSVEDSNEIAQVLTDKLDTVDASLLVQCVNNLCSVDEYLLVHSLNVALLNGMIGRWAKFAPLEIAALIKVGLLHDIGKLVTPPEILQKPGRLTEAEFAIMKQHPVNSYEILSNSGEKDQKVLQGVLHHHERMNGSGYPAKQGADQIPLYSRITAISDVYDAMVSQRVYKKASSPFKVLAEIYLDRFSVLDLKYVDIFLQHIPSVLEGKTAVLSDGSVGKIDHINLNRLAYPVVDVDGEVFSTNEAIYCLCMYDESATDERA